MIVQADICQLGMDQRKVNVLAREYCDDIRPKRKFKPVILSHPMMPGLLEVGHCLKHDEHWHITWLPFVEPSLRPSLQQQPSASLAFSCMSEGITGSCLLGPPIWTYAKLCTSASQPMKETI